MIPESPVETESNAERQLFERLRDETPDEIVAFHSVAWQLPGKNGRPEQGEADFVLAHPDYGVLTLEVKGGTVRYDAQAGQVVHDREEGRVADQGSRSPGAGARPTRSAARSRARRAEAARRSASGTPSPSPTAASRGRRCGPTSRASSSSTTRTSRAFPSGSTGSSATGSTRARRHRSARDGIDRLERLLANSFELRAPLAFELAEEERRLYRLTEQQYQVLDMLSRQTRVAIAGCAGSGKTFLAAEKARRLAAQGFRVLVVVFNVLLAEHLRRGLADEPNITVRAFYGLCREVAEEAGLEFADEPEPGEEGEYYTRLAAAFADHAELMSGRFDALIVDEGQDVAADWWLPLQILLVDPDRSPLYVFFDDNQKLFPVPTGLPFLEEPFQLTVNCRNTQRINELVMRFYKGGTMDAPGPEGPPVDRHVYETEAELLAQLDEAVAQWIGDGGGGARRHRAPDRARSAREARSGRWTRSAASA